MSEDLPKGWAAVKLRLLLAAPLSNGRSVPTDEHGFPVLRLTAIRNGVMDLSARKGGAWNADEATPFLVKEGDFLVSRGNGSIHLVGRGALVTSPPDPVAFPDTMIRIRPTREIFDPHYLALVWNSPAIRTQIEGSARTTAGIHKINQRILEDIDIPLPPLAEQHRIVEALEDHLSRLDVAERLLGVTLRRLDRLRESAMAPTQRIAATPPPDEAAPFPSPAGVDDGELPLIPATWRWMRLGELADVVGGVTKDAKKQADPDFVDVPYLRVANVQRGRIDLTTVAYIRVPKVKAAQLFLQRGDVLLNEGGDRDKLGRGWIWEDQIPEMIHQNHVFRARIRDQLLDPRLLAWHTNGFGRRWFEANGKQSVNLASISLNKIKMFPVPIPPGAEQAAMAQEIDRDLSIFDNTADLGKAAALKAATLRRALLTHAFSGKLVHQDPQDEPASELLARVTGAAVGGVTGRRAPHARSAVAAPSATRGVPSGIQEELPL